MPRSRSLLSLPPCSSVRRKAGGLHATALLGAAAVVGYRRVVFHRRHPQARGRQAVDRALASAARALDADLNLAHAHLAALAAAGLRGRRRGEGRALARALEADRAGRVPGERLAVGIGDGDDRVVVRGPDVGDAPDHVLANLALLRHSSLRGSFGPQWVVPARKLSWVRSPDVLRPRLLPSPTQDSGPPDPGPAFLALGLDALLAGDRLLLALAGARVGLGGLPADRETLAVALAAVTADVLQTLDVLADLAAERTLDYVVGVDVGVDRRELLLVDLVGPLVGVHAGLGQDFSGELRPDPVDVLEGEVDFLAVGDVDTGDTWHWRAPLIPEPACAWGPPCRSRERGLSGARSGRRCTSA